MTEVLNTAPAFPDVPEQAPQPARSGSSLRIAGLGSALVTCLAVNGIFWVPDARYRLAAAFDFNPDQRDVRVYDRAATPDEDFLATIINNNLYDGNFRLNCTPELPATPKANGFATHAYVTKYGMYGDSPVIHLGTRHCDDLVDFANTEKPDELLVDRAALAMSLLTHEVEHAMLRERNEAKTECATVQEITITAEMLGADAAAKRRIFERSAAIYWWHPPEYLDIEKCRDGGEYDLDPQVASTHFPAAA